MIADRPGSVQHCGEAISRLDEALALAQATDRPGSAARALHQLGIAHDLLGRHSDALEQQERALAGFRDVGDVRSMAHSLTAAGVVLRKLDRVAESADAHRQAIDIAKEIRASALELEALNGLGETLNATRPSDAAACHRDALARAIRLGDRAETARAHAGLGLAHRDLGDLTKAREDLKAALALYRALGAPEADAVRTLLAAICESVT